MKRVFLPIICLGILSTTSFASEYIYKKDYKDKWIFKGESYTLDCIERQNRPLIFISDGDGTYGINGAAIGLGNKMFGWKDGRKQLLPGKTPVDLMKFIEMGKKHCK